MNAPDIIISTVYDYYLNMSKKRKSIVPWFQTVSIISLSLTILAFLIYDIIFKIYEGGEKLSVVPVVVFLLLGAIFFICIKRYYFDNGKHLELHILFKEYSEKKIKNLKIIIVGTIVLLPFLLIFVIWYNAPI